MQGLHSSEVQKQLLLALGHSSPFLACQEKSRFAPEVLRVQHSMKGLESLCSALAGQMLEQDVV